MPINKNALERVLKNAHNELERRAARLLTETIETCYCTRHGHFASLHSLPAKSGEFSQMNLEFEACCEHLRSQVNAEVHLLLEHLNTTRGYG
jgi:hypothetical protein